MVEIWDDIKLKQKLDLIKGLISVDGNIVFGNTGFNKDSVILYGTFFSENEPKGVLYEVTKDHLEMLRDANTIQEVIEVYYDIGYFVES